LTVHFPDEPGLAGTRMSVLDFIRARDDGGGDDNWNYTVSRKKVTPCIHCHNSDKQCQILTEFWTNNAMS